MKTISSLKQREQEPPQKVIMPSVPVYTEPSPHRDAVPTLCTGLLPPVPHGGSGESKFVISSKSCLPFCDVVRVDTDSAISDKINELFDKGYTRFQVVSGLAGRFVIIAFLK